MQKQNPHQLAYLYGREAERIAANYFLAQGYRILIQNFRIRRAELDLVVLKGQCLVFVEVKARHPLTPVDPLFSIVKRKQQRLVWAARVFLYKHKDLLPYDLAEMRFDALVLAGNSVAEHRTGIIFL